MHKISYLFLIPLLLSLPACATNYSAEPITAWVVDAETNQPVEGVVVVAHWQLEGGLEGGNNLGQMMVMEAVTDAGGKFSFAAWGPKEMPGNYPLYASNARLKNMDPEMLFFKSGYQYLRLENNKTLEQIRGKEPYVRSSDWNGKTIKMERFKGGAKEYVRSLSFLMTNLRFIEDDCVWKIMPNMILKLQKQADIFKASGIVTAIYSVDYLPTNETKCGSPKEFFRSYHQ